MIIVGIIGHTDLFARLYRKPGGPVVDVHIIHIDASYSPDSLRIYIYTHRDSVDRVIHRYHHLVAVGKTDLILIILFLDRLAINSKSVTRDP